MCDKIFGPAGDIVIVEDKLLGEEASILAFVDGRNIYVMESSQDHKPIGDGDTGPNTGGMGAYSPAPVVTEGLMRQITREILVPVVDGMNRNGTPYKGVLYAGIMVTAGGPRVLEFNVRFGDPETQPLLYRMQDDLLPLLDGAARGGLAEWGPGDLGTGPSAVCVVMASDGYPRSYASGFPIEGLDELSAVSDVKVFHAGTRRVEGRWLTSGGRVLGVTARAESLEKACARAYQAVAGLSFKGAQARTDIALRGLREPGG